MAVWSLEPKRETEKWRRLDAEFWRPEYHEVDKLLSKCRNVYSLGAVAKRMRKGIFYILADEYVEHGVPFLRVSNVKSVFLDLNDLAYISEERNRQEAKTCFKRGDIVLNKTGDIGAAVIRLDSCNISQDLIGVQIADKSKFSSYYIATFLNTRYGQLQLQRWLQGQNQMHLALTDARNILVPFPRQEEQHEVEHTILSAEDERRKSDALYIEAQRTMMEELGWDKRGVSQPKWWTVALARTQKAYRLDAEYFQPRHQLSMRLMGKSGLQVKDVAKLVKRPFKPVVGTPFRYIEIGNLTADGFANGSTVMGEDAPSRAAWSVRANDVITSTVRPIRRLSALIEPQQEGFVCSSGFAVLEPKDIESEVLLVYLRLPLVCEILDLYTTASMYPAISATALLNFPITLPAAKARRRIVGKVNAARRARQKAEALLDEAKSRVEQLIESTSQ